MAYGHEIPLPIISREELNQAVDQILADDTSENDLQRHNRRLFWRRVKQKLGRALNRATASSEHRGEEGV